MNAHWHRVDKLLQRTSPSVASTNHTILTGLPYSKHTLRRKFQIGQRLFGYSAGFASNAVLNAIKAMPEVSYVEKDSWGTVAGGMQTGAPWGLALISQPYNPRNLSSTYMYDTENNGAGVKAYVLDSGVYDGHVAFESGHTVSYADLLGHGTHVAGIIGSTIYGVAKGVEINSVKVTDDNGHFRVSDVVAALSYVTQLHLRDWKQGRQAGYKGAIINMSLAAPFSRILNEAANNCAEQGIPVVVASGNDAADSCTVSPASAEHVITVGSLSTDEQSMSVFSNHGPCMTVLAPGESILSASNMDRYGALDRDGTSMAAAFATGMLAVHLSRHNFVARESTRDQSYAAYTALLQNSIRSDAITVYGSNTPNLIVHF
ncbi:subtilisin-like protein [Ramicandelaber brevisporus]|nr:subtilisin-like protein [Ramicandelaber brevisporus]